jgi:hypothetical protein
MRWSERRVMGRSGGGLRVGDGIGLSLSDRRNYRVDIESVSG